MTKKLAPSEPTPAGLSARAAEERRQAILDVAEALFAENGIAGTSVRSILATAGANVAAVHYHFGSKEKLVEEVFRRRAEKIAREQAKKQAEADRKAAEEARKAAEEQKKREAEEDKKDQVVADAAARLKNAQAAYQAELAKTKRGGK